MLAKVYNPKETEERIYKFWEKAGVFKAKIVKSKKPFTILLPPPNANNPLHIGHALYVVEDILCRWHRLKGDPTLFLPGTDHAGIESQYVFEKELRKKGKSRFDFDRETLYKMLQDFVDKNRGIAKEQMKRLGFSLDWSRERYTLDPNILNTVFETFKKLHKDGLIYREERPVNYCPKCGTAFSELEVVYKERKDPLYYMKYGPFVIATVRPETKFGDTAVAVNPKDKRYQKWVGKEFKYLSLIGPRKMKVVADEAVDPDFGTGVVKVTPAHDPNDFEIAKRHNLEILKVIDLDGKLNKNTGRFAGLSINKAREKVVEELKKRGDLVKVDENYVHRVGTCYRCKHTIEPVLLPQWFVRIAPLAEPAIKAVKTGKTKIIPKRFEKLYLHWMKNIKDWNVSRQIVWGPQIPAWYCLECNSDIVLDFIDKDKKGVSGKYKALKKKYSFSEIKKGLQQLTAPKNAVYSLNNKPCKKCKGKNILQETDTFDTWFSSGQWPLTTLGFPNSADFKYFYPTSVLDTMWDILFFWVARMLMLGIYRVKKVPFKIAHMHSRVVDKKGQKMSKSRGNVINPMDMVEKYGADALRMALVFASSPGSDICIDDDRVRAMRNFGNKIWNAARFVLQEGSESKVKSQKSKIQIKNQNLRVSHKDDKWILRELNKVSKKVNLNLERFRFDWTSQAIYQFFWHSFCDKYIEMTKKRRKEAQPVLLEVLKKSLILIHPFMPFITEEIYQRLPLKNKKKSLMLETWPE